jgi:putative hydrolase of the HAD superfamily
VGRALLLDLGNVLVRFDHGRTLAALEAATGVAAAALRPHVFGPLEREFDLGLVDAPAFFRAVEAEASLPRLPDGVWIPAWRDIFTRDDAALALLPRLGPGVTPVLVSNTNALHWEGVLRVAPEVPDLLPRRALSFEVGAAKPDPRHFEAALALGGATAREAAFADDRSEMVEAARALGIDAFVVRTSTDLEDELRARGLLVS